jgi:hypothetical protein
MPNCKAWAYLQIRYYGETKSGIIFLKNAMSFQITPSVVFQPGPSSILTCTVADRLARTVVVVADVVVVVPSSTPEALLASELADLHLLPSCSGRRAGV